jgi:hypothetical protein
MEFRNPHYLKLRDWISTDNFDWSYLCDSPQAINLLKASIEKINWRWLSKHPAAIHLLKLNLDKIDWEWLSRNSVAISLLDGNLSEINCNYLSSNPAIFTYDYDKIKENRKQINKEIIEYYWHPKRMNLWMWQEDD